MSKQKICKNCEYFRPNDASTLDSGQGGTCLRFPPTPMLMQQPANILNAGGVGMAGVNAPVVSVHTCGEFLAISAAAATVREQRAALQVK